MDKPTKPKLDAYVYIWAYLIILISGAGICELIWGIPTRDKFVGVWLALGTAAVLYFMFIDYFKSINKYLREKREYESKEKSDGTNS